jgi:hypothetical protein
MTNCNFPGQISNRNFLTTVGFKFTLAKYPQVDFFANSARIPEISLATTIQPSYLKDIDVPGEKLTYGDLTLRFIVDENMENYIAVYNWLTGLGFPETTQQFKNLTTDDAGQRDMLEAFSDGTLRVLNSNYKEVVKVKFLDLFPTSLSSIDFDATPTDIQYFTAQASFKYTVYTITSSIK